MIIPFPFFIFYNWFEEEDKPEEKEKYVPRDLTPTQAGLLSIHLKTLSEQTDTNPLLTESQKAELKYRQLLDAFYEKA